MEDLVRLIINVVEPKSWRGPDCFIHEANGTRLDIRTTERAHREIADLLAALRRLLDVSIVMEAGLYEVERPYYEKSLAPQLRRSRSLPLLLDDREEAQFRRAARLALNNKVRLLDSRRQPVFSLRRAIPYQGLPSRATDPATEIALVGVHLETAAEVLADRTGVRVKITQHGTELLGMLKEINHDAAGNPVTRHVPDLRKSSTSSSLTVNDCALVLLPPAVPPPGYTSKDRVPILFLRPYISIGDEERQFNNRNGK